MKVNIIGNGVFGSFLRKIMEPIFEITENADIVILAVPHNAYSETAENNKTKHLVNICSIQSITTDICRNASNRVTSIHPLFGPNTPPDKRHLIITFRSEESDLFIDEFRFLCSSVSEMPPEEHDRLMARTHAQYIKAVELIKPIVDNASDIPDNNIPNSFRKLRELVDQYNDMPQGTVDSIMANPFLDEVDAMNAYRKAAKKYDGALRKLAEDD